MRERRGGSECAGMRVCVHVDPIVRCGPSVVLTSSYVLVKQCVGIISLTLVDGWQGDGCVVEALGRATVQQLKSRAITRPVGILGFTLASLPICSAHCIYTQRLHVRAHPAQPVTACTRVESPFHRGGAWPAQCRVTAQRGDVEFEARDVHVCTDCL
jgi:hypothetical protein